MATKHPRAIGPHLPAEYDIPHASALQAMHAGTATAHQQQTALKWIIEQAAGTYEAHFYPTDRETSFSLGRCFVGQQIVKLLRVNVSTLRRAEDVAKDR
jgi:hypothetical protein